METLRYIKKRAGDKKESVSTYVDGSRKMLQLNIGIMNKQHEVIKLRDMIQEEEQKLNSARSAFGEETQRFNTFLFESQQATERLEQQNKEAGELKTNLDAQIKKLVQENEDAEAEINFVNGEYDKNKEYMQFLTDLIKNFRPMLLPKGGLKPLPDAAPEKDDKVFVTSTKAQFKI
jgi:chromosome segregation ATPase